MRLPENCAEIWQTTARNFECGRYYHFLMANQPDWPDWVQRVAHDKRSVINALKRDMLGQLARVKPFEPPNDWVGWTGA